MDIVFITIKLMLPKATIYSLNCSTLYKKIASNTIAQVISKALTALISIFLIGILTKSLPQELYGSYNKVFHYLWIFAFLADLWLYTITIREISRGKQSKEKIIWNVLTLRILLGVIIAVLACCIAYFLPAYRDMYTFSAVVIISIFTIISLINSSILALMQSQMKMEFSLFSLVAWKLVNLGLVWYFLLVYFSGVESSYGAFISIFIIATIWVWVTTLLNYIYARNICSLRPRFDSEYIKYIFRISLPYGIALFLSVVYFKIDVILLSLMETPKQADISIALYGLPMKIVEVLMVLWGFYLNSLLPSLTKYAKEKKRQDIARLFSISIKILGSFGIFICLMGNLFKTEIISIIATQEYVAPNLSQYSSVDVLGVVFFVLLFHFLSLVFIYILIAFEKQAVLLKINLAVTLLNIIWNLLVIPYYSFFWAAVVTLLSQMFLLVLSYIVVWRHVVLKFQDFSALLKSTCIALVLYVSFDLYFSQEVFWNITKMFIFVPIISILYIWFEYIFSKRQFQSFISPQ